MAEYFRAVETCSLCFCDLATPSWPTLPHSSYSTDTPFNIPSASILQPLRFWSRKERATRSAGKGLNLADDPTWAPAFTILPEGAAPHAANMDIMGPGQMMLQLHPLAPPPLPGNVVLFGGGAVQQGQQQQQQGPNQAQQQQAQQQQQLQQAPEQVAQQQEEGEVNQDLDEQQQQHEMDAQGPEVEEEHQQQPDAADQQQQQQNELNGQGEQQQAQLAAAVHHLHHQQQPQNAAQQLDDHIHGAIGDLVGDLLDVILPHAQQQQQQQEEAQAEQQQQPQQQAQQPQQQQPQNAAVPLHEQMGQLVANALQGLFQQGPLQLAQGPGAQGPGAHGPMLQGLLNLDAHAGQIPHLQFHMPPEMMWHLGGHGGGGAGARRSEPLLLTAAAFLAKQIRPPSSSSFSVEQLLVLIEEYLGAAAVDVVKALTGSTACPAAARGFWGSLFLGVMLCATAGVPVDAAQRLVDAVWRRSAAKSGLQDTKTAAASEVPADAASAAAAGGGSSGGGKFKLLEEEEGLLNRYSLREFVSAMVLLLRYREMHLRYDCQDVKQLHDSLLQVRGA